VEKYQKDPTSVFLPDEPLILLKEGRFNRVPWIVGMNSEEGIVVSASRKGQFRKKDLGILDFLSSLHF
jgi:hypothetical protein